MTSVIDCFAIKVRISIKHCVRKNCLLLNCDFKYNERFVTFVSKFVSTLCFVQIQYLIFKCIRIKNISVVGQILEYCKRLPRNKVS